MAGTRRCDVCVRIRVAETGEFLPLVGAITSPAAVAEAGVVVGPATAAGLPLIKSKF